MVHEAANDFLASPRASNEALSAVIDIQGKLMLLRRRARWLRKGGLVRDEAAEVLVYLDRCMRNRTYPTSRIELLGPRLDNLVFYFKPGHDLKNRINRSRRSDGDAELP
jgi:hypothetical protein